MKRLVTLIIAFVIALGLCPRTLRAAEASFALGFLPAATTVEQLIVRGTAPRGQTVAIHLNGQVIARVTAGPSMDVYLATVTLEPGENRIAAALEGTDLTLAGRVVRITRTFSDLTGHWVRQDAEVLASVGVVDGISADTFGPDLPLTRAQFAKLLALALKLEPERVAPKVFGDYHNIPQWARHPVNAVVKQGLITGFEDGTFRPGEPVSRVQVAVIAARAVRLLGAPPGGTPRTFTDQIPAWAMSDVQQATANGVIGDFWGSEFAPQRPATRADATAVVRRIYDLRMTR